MKVYLFNPHNPPTEEIASNYDKCVMLNDLQQQLLQAEATEVFAGDVLDYVVPRNQILEAILDKVRYGGRIVFTGLDLDEAARATVTRFIDTETSINLFYAGRASAVPLLYMKGILTQYGYKILNARLDGLYYMITVERSGQTSSA